MTLKTPIFQFYPFKRMKPTRWTPIYSQWSESKWHSFLLLQLLSLPPLLFPSGPDDLKHPGKWGRGRGESRIAWLHELSRRHLWNKVTLIATCLLHRSVNPCDDCARALYVRVPIKNRVIGHFCLNDVWPCQVSSS